MFLLKKLLSQGLMPLSLLVFCLALGALLLWFSQRQRLGKVLVTLGLGLLLAQSYGWGVKPALRELERAFPPLIDTTHLAGVKWVVVLGGGTSADESLPLATRLSEASLARLVEGVRLQRQLTGAKLLVSGGKVFGYGADADAMREVAINLGVNAADIISDSESPDTETQARIIRQIVGNARVVLVTSAAHMPRAVALFQQVGMDVIPAPTNYLVQSNAAFSPTDIFPSERGFIEAHSATHEYLGLLWGRLRGQ